MRRRPFRSPGIMEPQERDWRLIRRLLKRADQAAEAPAREAMAFHRAACGASKAVLPLGHRAKGSPFIVLIRIGQRFMVLSETQRAAQAQTLRELVAACREAMAPTESNQRKDVFG